MISGFAEDLKGPNNREIGPVISQEICEIKRFHKRQSLLRGFQNISQIVQRVSALPHTGTNCFKICFPMWGFRADFMTRSTSIPSLTAKLRLSLTNSNKVGA